MGKPSRGTPADKRLKENKPASPARPPTAKSYPPKPGAKRGR